MQKFKRAFTIVELTIVIAVIAVLCAVLIPTFVTVFKNAQITADSTNLSGANSIIFSESLLGEEVDGVESAQDLLLQNGVNLSTLKPKNEQAFFAWDNFSKQLICVDGNLNLLYSSKEYNAQNADLWLIISTAQEFLTLPQGVNCYITSGAQGNFTANQNATYNGKIIVQSGANITVSGNILSQIFVNDGAIVNGAQTLNLYYPLIIQSAVGGQLTPNYPLDNGNFAKVGASINLNCEADEGYEVLSVLANGEALTLQNENYVFTMPAQKVEVVATFNKSTAQNTQIINGITYTFIEDGQNNYYKITSANGEEINTEQTNGYLILEQEIEYNGNTYPVKAIGEKALQNLSATNIVVPQSITEIGYLAFAKNTNLKSVIFLASLVNVSNDANGILKTSYPFFGCNIEQLTLYYTAINDISSTETNNDWQIVGAIEQNGEAEYFYIPEQNLITENWTWNSETYELSVEYNSTTPDGGDDNNNGENNGDDNNGGDNNDGENNGDDNNGGDNNDGDDNNGSETPDAPQTFTVTVVMDFRGADNLLWYIYPNGVEYNSKLTYSFVVCEVSKDSSLTVNFASDSKVRIITDNNYDVYANINALNTNSRENIDKLFVDSTELSRDETTGLEKSIKLEQINSNIIITIIY